MSLQQESNHIVDYIIIGQGIAGSILAHQLTLREKSVLVIDNNHFQSATKVAAGIINPITGPRLALTNGFDLYYPKAKEYYASLEKILTINLWQELLQHRSIQNQLQANFYDKRAKDDDYKNSLGGKAQSPYFNSGLGAIDIFQSTVIDTKTLISEIRNWLIALDRYRSIKLDYQKIEVVENGFIIDNIKSQHIIFCEGFQAINNPWLSHLPFKLSKGEILTLDTNKPVTHLLNWGNWLAPIGENSKLGSNYEWNDLNLNPDEKVMHQLLDSLKSHTNIEGRVINQEAGIRPTTRQRKPFIGPLNNLIGTYCFNGFGSKGCLLIPHYAELFCDHLLNQQPLDKDLTVWL